MAEPRCLGARAGGVFRGEPSDGLKPGMDAAAEKRVAVM